MEASDNCLIHNNLIDPPLTCQTAGVSHLPPAEFVAATPLSTGAGQNQRLGGYEYLRYWETDDWSSVVVVGSEAPGLVVGGGDGYSDFGF